MSSGLWLRGGMDGSIVGLDIHAALSRPSLKHNDPEILEFFLTAIEAGALSGAARARSRQSQN